MYVGKINPRMHHLSNFERIIHNSIILCVIVLNSLLLIRQRNSKSIFNNIYFFLLKCKGKTIFFYKMSHKPENQRKFDHIQVLKNLRFYSYYVFKVFKEQHDLKVSFFQFAVFYPQGAPQNDLFCHFAVTPDLFKFFFGLMY